ncbi:hypothetical protein [Methylobacterium sp. J-070]|uniref:hypothetical protein n=1 Tax=Methylobacterium sp. J-070 TaxID=2836650 RepID=UPI001FB9FFCD|nr:hypothetical protein [Methylobacterium sp. J-070]MCJ2051805.1 hypothetical protein [Methylobacterium sp. J-070]
MIEQAMTGLVGLFHRRALLLGSAMLVLPLLWPTNAPAQADPLPSWAESGPKRAIVKFIGRVMREDGLDFVPMPEGSATFDRIASIEAELAPTSSKKIA